MFKSLMLIVIFPMSLLYSNININNPIDSDKVIRNMAFFGPYSVNINSDSLSNSFSDYQFNKNSILKIGSTSHKIKNVTSMGSNGMHYLWQAYKEIIAGQKIIGVANILSTKSQKVAFNGSRGDVDIQLYINNELVLDTKTFFELPILIDLEKGANKLLAVFECKEIPFIVFQLQPKFCEISGTIKDVNGNPSPFTNVGLYDYKNHQSTGWKRSDEKGKYNTIITELKENSKFELRAFSGEKYAVSLIDNLKSGQKLTINPVIKKRPVLAGKVLNLDGKSIQFGILVQAVPYNNNYNIERVYTDRQGEFKFPRLKYDKYYLRIHGKDKYHYFKNKNGQKRVFTLKNNEKGYEELEIRIGNLAKGTWEQVSYIDGIQSNYSRSNLIDNDNQLWIGSYTGLTIYDGQEMRNFTTEDGLPNAPVVHIFQDKEENVWVSSFDGQNNIGGLSLFQKDSLVEVFDFENGLAGNVVWASDQDMNGNIIIGGNGGFQIFGGDSLLSYDYTDGVANGWVTCFYVEGNNIWIGTGDGLVKFNGKRFQNFTTDDGIVNGYISVIKKAPDGKLWFGTEGGGISIYDGTVFNNLTWADGLPDNRIKDIYFDDTGDVLISTQGGLVKYNYKTFVRLSPRSLGYDFGFINPNKINKTQDGIYWISDNGGSGILKYDPRSLINITKVDSFPSGQINEVVADKNNNLWLASNNKGLIHITNDKVIKTLTIKNGLRSNQINDVELDLYNNIWIATANGLSKYDGRSITNYTTKDGLPRDFISSVYADDVGNIWLGTRVGLVKYDGEKFETYGENEGLFSFNTGRGLKVEGNKESICIGSYGTGISIFDGKVFKNLSEKDGLSDTRVTAIGMDSENNVWVGSDGSGVYKYDGEKFINYSKDDGVPNPEIFTLYIDDMDKIWVGTYGGGVGSFDGQNWGTIDTRDGLIQNVIQAISSYGETYWLAGWKGVTKYRPSKSSGFVNIKKIQTSQNEYYADNSIIPESITGNRISFLVNAANYNTQKEKQKFRYKIKELNNTWSKPLNSSVIDIVPKKSGDFTFEVQSIDRDMNYSPIASVKYRIKKPWYFEASTAIPFWGIIFSILSFSGYSTKKYNNQKLYSLKLKEEAQKKDREVRKKLELNNAELIDSQKAAEAANAAKSTFLANMSHELRTPLNAIIGYSEMLIEDAEDENEDFIPDLDKINGSGKHLLGLINDILDLSKVESGKMELFIEEFELSKILKEIEATIKPLVEKNNNTLIIHIEDEIKTISADITKIRQIMLNLLSNSSKFTNKGEITFSIVNSTLMDNAYDFIVSDSGIGMSQEQVDKVFKPFTQADEKTTRKFGGTGLGLTITKMFAEMMGGEINLSSIEGKGTTFTVTIPKTVKDIKENEIELTTTVDPENPYTILVIDDDNNAQDMMKKFLQKQSISILQAKSGEEGLKMAAEHMPDAITLDVMMPEMDGWEVLAALQANDKIKNIPVIMLTMADEPDIGFSLGATDYLTKPVNWNQLSSILKKHQIQSNSESIMIVEDDEITRGMLRKSLENNEFKVRSAVNGKEALEKIKKAKPGLIILDLMMPEMDGFEFSEKLRENKDWLDIPVVVITAKDLTKEDHNRLKGNVEAIMQKGSYSKKELLAEVGERIKRLQTKG